MNFNITGIVKTTLLASLFLIVTSCGGGGGGGGAPSVTDGRTAAIEAGKGIYTYQQAGTIGGSTRAVNARKGILRFVMAGLNGELRDRGTWEYDSEFELYYRVTIDTDTRFRVEFAEFEDGSGGRGYVDLKLTNGEPYPIAGTVEFGFTAGRFRLSGKFTIDIADEGLNDVRVRADIRSARPNTQVKFDIREVFGSGTGWLEAKDSSDSIRLSDIEYDADLMTADFNANGATGSLFLEGDGSGACTVEAPNGTWVLTWDSDFYAKLTPPGGSPETLGYLWELQ